MGNIINNTLFRWPHQIDFIIDPGVPDQQRVIDAVADWEAHTSIHFNNLGNPTVLPNPYIRFERWNTSGSNAESVSGITNPVQNGIGKNPSALNGLHIIRFDDDATAEIISHEIGHILGMFHEHQRSDRNTFIIISSNLNSDGFRQVGNIPVNSRPVGVYDFCSIMHYGSEREYLVTNPSISSEIYQVISPIPNDHFRFVSSNCPDHLNNLPGLFHPSQLDLYIINLMYGLNRRIEPGESTRIAFVLKQFLKNLGYDPGSIDQNYDNNAQNAVIEFQSAETLTSSSTLNQETWDRLATKFPYNIGTIQIGNVGPQVRLLQAELASLGLDIAIDGIFGETTDAALRMFQTDVGINSTGTVDTDTEEKLSHLLKGGII